MYVVSAGVLGKWSLLSDAQLVAHVVGGRTALFEILMRRHAERLYRTVRAIVTDDARAEDLLQQVFVMAYVGLRQFDGTQSFAVWLTHIAVRTARSLPRHAAVASKQPWRQRTDCHL